MNYIKLKAEITNDPLTRATEIGLSVVHVGHITTAKG